MSYVYNLGSVDVVSRLGAFELMLKLAAELGETRSLEPYLETAAQEVASSNAVPNDRMKSFFLLLSGVMKADEKASSKYLLKYLLAFHLEYVWATR